MIAPTAGSSLTSRRVAPVDADAMKTMAVILDDPNIIHLDAGAVRRLGLGDRVINQGPSNCGYVLDMLLSNFPAARVAAFQARFLANVLGGDDVAAGGTIDTVRQTPDGWEVECSIWLDVADRGRALEGTARLLVPGS